MSVLLDIIKAVSQTTNKELTAKEVNNETLKDHLVRLFNFYNKDFNNRNNWPWNSKEFVVQTIPNYTTGSVSVTKDSRTVTGSGTVWTSAMAGRFLKLNRDNETYEILAVASGTSMTVKTPYIGDTVSGQSYLIWNKFYSLDPDVPLAGNMYLSKWPYNTDKINGNTIREQFANPYQTGYPRFWTWEKINRTVATYSAGNLTVAKDSRTFTGSGTAWLDNIYPGTQVTVGVNVYNVEQVDSDTQFTSVQKAITAVGNSSYTAETRDRSQISFSAVPDPAVNIMGIYFKKTYDYKNDNDDIFLWPGFEHILTSVLTGHIREKQTDEQTAFAWLTIYENQIAHAWSNLQKNGASDTVPRVHGRAVISGYRSALYG